MSSPTTRRNVPSSMRSEPAVESPRRRPPSGGQARSHQRRPSRRWRRARGRQRGPRRIDLPCDVGHRRSPFICSLAAHAAAGRSDRVRSGAGKSGARGKRRGRICQGAGRWRPSPADSDRKNRLLRDFNDWTSGGKIRVTRHQESQSRSRALTMNCSKGDSASNASITPSGKSESQTWDSVQLANANSDFRFRSSMQG